MASSLTAPATAPVIATAKAAPPICIYAHIDIADRHAGSPHLSCVTGWIVAETGFEVVSLHLQVGEGRWVRCRYPFYRGDMVASIRLAGSEALTGFNVLLPKQLGLPASRLAFAASIAPDNAQARLWRFEIPVKTGRTVELRLGKGQELRALPVPEDITDDEAGPILESRLLDQLARERRLTLRLDLINKCNLRCVMCHYSDEAFSKRPAQRISPEKFADWFDPLAPAVRDVVLSCGDEPLMSPHFEEIVRGIADRDPEVRIRFCTNAMLLTDKVAETVVAARAYLVMLSFDSVTSETLHRIRVGSDYRRIVRNIVGLKRARARSAGPNPRLVFNFVMMESNIHEAPHFVRMARRLGGDYIDFRHVVPFEHYDIEHEMLENYRPKFNFYRSQICAEAEAAGIEIYIPPAFATAVHYNPAGDPACSLGEFHEVLRELGEDPLVDADPPRASCPEALGRITESAHYFCDRPFSEVMIREQRDVYPCPWHREKMGALDDFTTLEEIFFGEKFRRVRLAMLDPNGAPGCAGCPIKLNRLPTRRERSP